jgi:hypothetical protein
MAISLQKFGFEHSAVELTCGTLFQPLKHGQNRWIDAQPSQSRYSCLDALVLYEHTDGRFLTILYRDCQSTQVRIGDDELQLWCSNTRAVGKFITPAAALAFILKIEAPIPESLALECQSFEERRRAELQLAKQNSPETVTIRPLQFWKDAECLPRPGQWFGHYQGETVTAHDVDFNQLSRKRYLTAVELVQVIRRWSTQEIALLRLPPDWSEDFINCLFLSYPVDPERWWGDTECVPPESATLMELQWPKHLRGVKSQMERLRALIELPMHCLAACARSRDERPTREEAELAYLELVQLCEKIERATVRLGASLRELALVGKETADAKQDDDLPPAIAAALNSYDLAEARLMESGANRVTDDMAYDWLAENGPDEYDLPTRSSWKRYLGEGRAKTNAHKNTPVTGRAFRSIVRLDEI